MWSYTTTAPAGAVRAEFNFSSYDFFPSSTQLLCIQILCTYRYIFLYTYLREGIYTNRSHACLCVCVCLCVYSRARQGQKDWISRYHMVPRARPAGLGWVPVQQRAEDFTTAERTCLTSKSHICHYYTTIREYNIIIILYYSRHSRHISTHYLRLKIDMASCIKQHGTRQIHACSYV